MGMGTVYPPRLPTILRYLAKNYFHYTSMMALDANGTVVELKAIKVSRRVILKKKKNVAVYPLLRRIRHTHTHTHTHTRTSLFTDVVRT